MTNFKRSQQDEKLSRTDSNQFYVEIQELKNERKFSNLALEKKNIHSRSSIYEKICKNMDSSRNNRSSNTLSRDE
jgi:hypothetical protein